MRGKREPGYTSEDHWDFWVWLKDLAAIYQHKNPYFMGFSVEAEAGFKGIVFTLSGNGYDKINVEPGETLYKAVEVFAKKEAAKIGPNIIPKVEKISDHRVACDFDIAGF